MKKVIIALLSLLILVNATAVGAEKEDRRFRFRFGEKQDEPAQPAPTQPPTQPGPTNPPSTTTAPRIIRESDSAVRDFLDEPTDNPMTPTPTPKGFRMPTSVPPTQVQSSPHVSGDELTVAFLVIVFITYAIHKGWIDQLQKKYLPATKRRKK